MNDRNMIIGMEQYGGTCWVFRIEVNGPCGIIFLDQPPRPRGYYIKNWHQKHICYNKIGLFAWNIDTILGQIVNTMENAHVITWWLWKSSTYEYRISFQN